MVLGRLALWVAALAGIGSLAVGLRGRGAARRLLATAACGGALATLLLALALLDNDFSWAYVADHSRRHASTPYRLASLWGGMAGSLTFFATLLAAVGWVAAGRAGRFGARTAAAVAGLCGGLVAALAALVLVFADPFERLDLPAIEGRGLTPILEHPAMLYHPPLLYLGLVSLAPPAALTLAAVGTGGIGPDEWSATVRRWLAVPWTLLAVGMVAGAHWAYVELGWGGYWAWDPVENTALLPWLAVTMALHAMVPGRVGQWRYGAASLVCVAFTLAMAGTMLTRSGAVASVHAFGEDRAIGRGLAALLGVVAIGAAVVLGRGRTAFVGRGPSPTDGAERASLSVGAAVNEAVPTAAPPSVSGTPRPVRSLVLVVVGHLAAVGGVLVVATAGTAAPLVRELAGGDDVAVEGRYFAAFAGPLTVVGLALLVLVPVVTSLPQRTDIAGGSSEDGAARVLRRWHVVHATAACVGAVGAVALLQRVGGEVGTAAVSLAAASGAALAAGLVGVVTAMRPGPRSLARAGSGDDSTRLTGRLRRAVPHVAHAGLALLLLGVAGTVSGETTTVPLRAGDSIQVGEEVVHYRGVTATEDDAGRPAVAAIVEVSGRVLRPSLVAHEQRGELLAETSLISGPLRDVQVGLRRAHVDDAQSNADAVATLQIGVYPLQVLVWWGALILVAAGLALLLLPHRANGSPQPDPRQ